MTVAWITPAPGILHLGFSFCSPKDRWCKITGRDMAMERLYDDPLVVPYLYDAKRTTLDVVRAVLTHNRRLTAFADAVPPLLRVPDWTKALGWKMGERHIYHWFEKEAARREGKSEAMALLDIIRRRMRHHHPNLGELYLTP